MEENKMFEAPEIKEILEEKEFDMESGKQSCDTYDWSGCCYNG